MFIYKKKKSQKEAIELEPDSNHIVLKKQKLDLLKHQMNVELNNKRKIVEEFDEIAKLNKANQCVSVGDHDPKIE